MQLSRLLVSYPGMKELLRQMLETAPLSDRRIIAAAMAGFSRAAHGSRDAAATRAVSGLKAIWPQRRRLLRRATREQRDRTRFAGCTILEPLRTPNECQRPLRPEKNCTRRRNEL